MYWRYLNALLRHKWFVFLEACKLGIPWLGLIHDLSKFAPCEFIAYARNFFGDGLQMTAEHGLDFDYAWNHHQKRNRHHWQYWILQYDQSEKWDIHECEAGHYLLMEYMLFGVDYDVRCTPGVEEILMSDLGTVPIALPMPERYIREMVADWRGAGRAYGDPDTQAWYRKNAHRQIMHPETRRQVEALLGVAPTG